MVSLCALLYAGCDVQCAVKQWTLHMPPPLRTEYTATHRQFSYFGALINLVKWGGGQTGPKICCQPPPLPQSRTTHQQVCLPSILSFKDPEYLARSNHSPAQS